MKKRYEKFSDRKKNAIKTKNVQVIQKKCTKPFLIFYLNDEGIASRFIFVKLCPGIIGGDCK